MSYYINGDFYAKNGGFMKKVFSLMLAVLSLISVIPLTANAAFIDSGTCGENLTWTLDEEGTLTISGTGAMMQYNYNRVPWYSNRSLIKKVIIEDGVTTIERYAFYHCSSLTSIEIPSSVTAIAYSAFDWCSSLEGVYITDLDAWLNIDFDDYSATPFSYANKLYLNVEEVTEVIFPEGTTEIKPYALYSLSNITSVEIPEGVTEIGDSAFFCCSSLMNIEIPEGVTAIGDNAFRGCSSLMNIEIPSSVTTIGSSAFQNCSALTSIKIPSSVTAIESNAFYMCGSLTRVDITDLEAWLNIDFKNGHSNPLQCAHKLYLNGEEVHEVIFPENTIEIKPRVFLGGNNITSVEIPKGVISIGRSAFFGCNSLTDVYYGGWQKLWDEIDIHEENECLINATLHFTHVHEYKENVVQALSCTNDAVLTYTCVCEHSYTDTIKTEGHKMYKDHVVSYPTCTENGRALCVCEVCGYEEYRGIVATGHEYDNDGVCMDCGYNSSPSENCSHICHKSGFMGFLWKLVSFFSKLFGMNTVCECGMAHY